MLKKLYLYDLYALRRTVLPFLLASPAVALLAFGIIELSTLLQTENIVLFTSLILLYFLCLLGIALLNTAVLFIVIFRYYKNFFTDEGYLTLVLPASMRAQVCAKIFSGVTVSALTSVAVWLSFGIAIGLPIALSVDATYFFSGLLDMFASIGFGFNGLSGVLAVISMITSLFAQIILLYTAITLGSLLMRRHKIFGSILFYFVINLVVSAVNSLFSGVLGIFLSTANSVEDLSLANMLSYSVTTLLNVALSFGGYFAIYSMMHKKLNLE